MLMIALPVKFTLQTGVLKLATLTKAYVDAVVNTGVLTVAFPVASKVTV